MPQLQQALTVSGNFYWTMKTLIIIIGVLTLSQLTFGQSVGDLAANKNEHLIRRLQKSVDKGFTDDWNLKSIEKQDIDHFQPGVVITWERKLNGEKIIRTYSFNIDSQLSYANERRTKNDSLQCQGHVRLKDNFVSYITLAYIDRKTLTIDALNYNEDYKVSHYEYEIFTDGKLHCIYRSKWINHYEDLFADKNKGKIQLVKGVDCLQLSK